MINSNPELANALRKPDGSLDVTEFNAFLKERGVKGKPTAQDEQAFIDWKKEQANG